MNYFRNINEKNVTENKNVRKAEKPKLLNKYVGAKKKILVKNQKILLTDNEMVKASSYIFSNTIQTLDITKFDHVDR